MRPEAEAIPYADAGTYHCERCRAQNQVAILPNSPRISKHRCFHCGFTNECETRISGFDELAGGPGAFDDHVGEGKDRNQFERRKPVSVTVSSGFTVIDRRPIHDDPN